MRYLKFTLAIVLILAVSMACEVNTSKFPSNPNELHSAENTGGFLRIAETISPGFDNTNINEAFYEIVLEADDALDGQQMDSVAFNIAYIDADIADTSDTVAFRLVDSSEFTPSEESGLPSYNFRVTSQQAAQALGRNLADFDTFDEVIFTWTLYLENGKSFDQNNVGANITGGAFYNSPFQSIAPVAPLVDPSLFVGTYEVTQVATSSSISGAFGNGYLFDDDDDADAVEDQIFTVELTLDPDNTLFGRVMSGMTYQAQIVPGLDGAGSFRFQMIRGATTAENRVNFLDQPTGITCGGPGINLAPATNDGSFDIADDSQFTMYLVENSNSGCGVPPSADLQFNFVKQ